MSPSSGGPRAGRSRRRRHPRRPRRRRRYRKRTSLPGGCAISDVPGLACRARCGSLTALWRHYKLGATSGCRPGLPRGGREQTRNRACVAPEMASGVTLPGDLRERLSSLRRGQPRGGAPVARAAAPRFTSHLSQCFPEGAVGTTARGEVFSCEVPLSEIHSEASQLRDRYLGAFAALAGRGEDESVPRQLRPLTAADPDTTALIDTETAGFHGRPLFLIGLIYHQGGELRLVQHFARDYAEEAALLAKFVELLPQLRLLVSFNGKAFDWPFIRDRIVYHRLHAEASFEHIDLLHASRRRWRGQLPNCQLQTLERHLCGRWRQGDVPSHEVPQRYHSFVREQDARLIAPVFHHNRLDLITMIELLVALADGARPSSRLARAEVSDV